MPFPPPWSRGRTPETGGLLRPVTRRRALLLGGALTGAALVGPPGPDGPAGRPPPPAPAAARLDRTLFAHGVASGDPWSTAVVLWTRVTPDPAATPGSGRGPECTVSWEVATDDGFRRIVRSGSVTTGPERDHTVTVDVAELQPSTTYWYRFGFRGAVSPAGRARTAPDPGAAVGRLRMAVVSCANLQAGWFGAYRHLAARDDLDVVVHLGDYLYEYGPGGYQASGVVVRPHDPPCETVTLADYRRRHAQYRSDPDLQALHAALPWVVTWDDHETANDAWSGGAENHTPGVEGEWAARRAAARRAYAEWMPVRWAAGDPLYRRLRFGRLAVLTMLDLRSHRDRPVGSPSDPRLADRRRSITGTEQMSFLLDGLADRHVQWTLVGTSVMFAPVRLPAGVNVDQWDGYPADRARVVEHLVEHGVRNAVFLTGDQHSGWASDLPADPLAYATTGESVGVEFACPSVTSDAIADGSGGEARGRAAAAAIRERNPHVRHLDLASHGFCVLEVTPAAAQMDWYALADRTDPRSAAVWSTSWRVPAGSPRVQRTGARIV
ncbi:MAG TPA: alkaline phosphatase D family protein [Geodermatophilus sp.]|nr:alkaline phosphatase D family protein [Geodermatophilus sp.]